MNTVSIYELFLRDGLQSLDKCYTVEERMEMFNLLNDCGLSGIEFGSTTKPTIVPQMKDSFVLWDYVKRHQQTNTKYTMLVPSIYHLDKVIESGIDSIGIIVSITDEFAYQNMRMNSEATFLQAKQIIDKYPGKHIRIYLSQSFDVSKKSLDTIHRYTKEFTEIAYSKRLENVDIEIVLADTVGICDVESMRGVLEAIEDKEFIGVHLHVKGTPQLFESIVDEVLDKGIIRFDTSLFGIGGCPYAKELIGNVSTIPLVKYLHKKGYQTGIDIDKLEKAVDYFKL
jgi:hydroxymethylglutaryl-CoA lyase